MLEEASSTACRLDDLLCVLTSRSQLMAASSARRRRNLPAALSATLQLFVKTHDHLMFADGPLSHQHRHYIALLVCAVIHRHIKTLTDSTYALVATAI